MTQRRGRAVNFFQTLKAVGEFEQTLKTSAETGASGYGFD
jgi:hypothetical protein